VTELQLAEFRMMNAVVQDSRAAKLKTDLRASVDQAHPIPPEAP